MNPLQKPLRHNVQTPGFLLLSLSLACLSIFPAWSQEIEENPLLPLEYSHGDFQNSIVLQGLNKVTGHISKLEAPVGTVMRFDNLEIIARRCWKASPEEQPENAALLEILELRTGEQPKTAFLGWMFSSSPGLSGLEHPVYDITVLDCENQTLEAD